MSIEESRYFGLIVVSVILLIGGIFMIVFAKKDVNVVFGYRTPASMKSPERFYFAQKFAGRLMILIAVISLLIAAYGYFLQPLCLEHKLSMAIIYVAQAVAIIVPTEIAIRRKFKKDE